MEKVTTKQLALYSGRTHPELAEEVAEAPRHRARRIRTSSSSPTARSGRGSPRASAAPTCSSCRPTTACDGRSHQRLDHGAADHDRRRLPGVGQADHRGVPVLRLRPPGPQGRGPRADHRPPVADMFKAAGAKRMVSIDLHTGQIQGFFDGPVDHLTAMPVLEDYLRDARHRARSSCRPTPVASRSPSAWPSTSATAAPTWPSSTSAGRRARPTSPRPRRSSATSRAGCASSPTT